MRIAASWRAELRQSASVSRRSSTAGAGYRELDVLGGPIMDTTPAAAAILVQPQDAYVPAGSVATLQVVASGYPLPVYQWMMNGTNVLAGKTSATLTIPNVSAADAGWYSVSVSNTLGQVVSRQASLRLVNVLSEHSTSVYPVSENDLLQMEVGWVDASTLIQSPESGSYTLSNLTDGLFNTDTNVNRAFSVSGGDLVYYLGTAEQFRGFAVSNINVYGGWPDPGRDAQNYVVSYSTVSQPTNFIDIATVAYNPPGSAPSYTAVQISDVSGGVLCTGVRALRFHFTAQENGAAGYREIDVLGTAIPVPSLSLVSKSTSGVLLALKGAANQSYSVLRASQVKGPWVSLASVPMGPDGSASYLDASAPSGAAYYRLFGP